MLQHLQPLPLTPNLTRSAYELSAQLNGLLTAPTLYESMMLLTPATVPEIWTNVPNIMRNTLSTTSSQYPALWGVLRRAQLSCSHMAPLICIHMTSVSKVEPRLTGPEQRAEEHDQRTEERDRHRKDEAHGRHEEGAAQPGGPMRLGVVREVGGAAEEADEEELGAEVGVEDDRGEEAWQGHAVRDLLEEEARAPQRRRAEVLPTEVVYDHANRDIGADDDGLACEEGAVELARVTHLADDRKEHRRSAVSDWH